MRALILLAALAGCYAPAIAPCQYTCSADERCPDGLTCNFQSVCAVATTDRCPSNACGWPAISNVDPCAPAIQADQVTADWTIDTIVTIETGDPGAPVPELAGVPAGARVAVVQQAGGPEVLVVVVGDLTIKNTLAARGARPLILLVNGTAALNQGSLLGVATGLPLTGGECTPAADLVGLDASGDNGGGGGGGGGFGRRVENTSSGAPGGSGGSPGSTINNGGKPGRLVTDTDALVPLRGGCSGGRGGGFVGSPSFSGGLGGAGGGAIQLSAKTSLVVRGMIAAPGLGGSNSNATHAGGGGGGAGGGILLEAPTVTFEQASLCASGGGGGAASSGNQATSGSCSFDGIFAENGGGDQMAAFAAGGQGATALNDAAPGKPGQTDPGTGFVRGAGGGGGGVGRIRINGTIVGAPKFSTPAFTSGPLL